VRPPLSLRKPRDSDKATNRSFLRGFSGAKSLDLSLLDRPLCLVGSFGASSLHPKIPFPIALELSSRIPMPQRWKFDFNAAKFEIFEWAELFRLEPERFELLAPSGGWIAKPLHADASGQATLYSCLD
jgi:hypothetical protein